MKQVFTLARRNFVAYKKIYAKIIVALVALLFLISLVCSFTLSVKTRQTQILYGSISSNYAQTDKKLDEGDIPQSFVTLEVDRVVIDEEAYKKLFAREGEYVYSDDTAIQADGEIYRCNVWYIFQAYVARGDIFTQNDYKEGGENASFLLGRYPQNADEIVLSERYLAGCGLSREVLGKTVSIYAVQRRWSNSNQKSDIFDSEAEYVYVPICQDLTVCGIITEDYTKLSGHGSFAPMVLCHEQSELAQYGLLREYVYSLDDWANKQTEKFFEESNIYYQGKGELDQIKATINLQLVVNQLVTYFGSALVFGIALTLALLCEKLCAFQMKNSGELLIAGLTNKRLFGVWLVQLAIASAIAVAVASALTIAASYGINAIIYNAFSLTLTVSAISYVLIFLVGLASVAVVTVAALGFFALKFKRKQTRELLDV